MSQVVWQQVGPNQFNQEVTSLFADSLMDRLYIGGNYKYYGQQIINGVCEYDGNSMYAMSCGVGNCGNISCLGPRQFEIFGNALYAIFIGDSIGCQAIHHLAKWENNQWVDMNQQFFENGYDIDPNYIKNFDSVLIVCGTFDSIETKSAQGIAFFDGNSWDTIYSCPLFTNTYLSIKPSLMYQGKLIAVNYLVDTLGEKQFLSFWNGSCWEKYTSAFSDISSGFDLIEYKSELYACGAFNLSHDPQAPGNSIARWNGSRWDDLEGGVRMTNSFYPGLIRGMTIYHDELYVVGVFEMAGNISANNIAKWDGTKWCSLGNNFDNPIRCISVFHDSLFIGGGFSTIDGDSISYLAKTFLDNTTDSCSSGIGINEISIQSKVTFYPNPTTDNLFLNLTDQGDNYISQIRIYSSTGSLVYFKSNLKTRNETINLENFGSGVYFVSIQTKFETFNKKLFIQR